MSGTVRAEGHLRAARQVRAAGRERDVRSCFVQHDETLAQTRLVPDRA